MNGVALLSWQPETIKRHVPCQGARRRVMYNVTADRQDGAFDPNSDMAANMQYLV
jgi:hypothetical protein